jgi:HD superfamily phosphodiesterase
MKQFKAYLEIREWYEKFVKLYHKNDLEFMRSINLKYDHCERVVIEARGLAVALELSDSDTEMVLVAALLHDLGRYEQLKKYGTFSDRDSVNHAELSLEIINNEDVLRFLDDNSVTPVLNAIRVHNMLEIPSNINGKSLLISKIIRDADKIDILRILGEHYSQTSKEKNRDIDFSLPDGEVISDDIDEWISSYSLVRTKDVENVTELKLLQLSWVFDLNYLWTSQIVEYRKFVHQIIKTLPDTVQINRLASIILNQLETKAEDAKILGFRAR